MADPLTDSLNRRAAFSAEFLNSGTLGQRRARAQDLSEAKARNDEREVQEFEALQIARPEVGRLMLAREREDRQAMEGSARIGLEQSRLERQMSRDVTMDDLAARRLEIQQNTEKRLLRKEALELDKLDREEEDTLSFQEIEKEARDQFGVRSTGYRNALLDAAVSLPYVNKELRQYALKESGFDDPDDAVAKWSDFVSKNPGARASVKVPGATVSIAGPKPPETISEDELDDEISKAYADRSAAKKAFKADPSEGQERRLMVEDRIRKLEARRQQLETPGPASPGPAPAAPGTTLDLEGARALIKEAGGDVNRARALAKERGLQY